MTLSIIAPKAGNEALCHAAQALQQGDRVHVACTVVNFLEVRLDEFASPIIA